MSDTELNKLRAQVESLTSPVPGLAESGPYTLTEVEAIEQHRGKPYARLRETIERVASLQQQLVAATKKAARAELRARELTKALFDLVGHTERAPLTLPDVRFAQAITKAKVAIAANPVSDERLREVMQKVAYVAADKGFDLGSGTYEKREKLRGVTVEMVANEAIDEVLGKKP